MNNKYEGNIGRYSFIMSDDDTIEVWSDDLGKPDSYIFVKKGSIQNQKDFEKEISFWYMNNTRL
jgi:hypothetical protein